MAGAFLVFLITDLLNRELALSSFSIDYPWIIRLLAGTGSIAATVFVAGLPISVRRLTLIVRDTTRSRDNELRLIAAAESSADSVILYDSVHDAAGEIRDFKFIFLNGNAAQTIGLDRSQVLGKNLYEVFPTIRTTDLFERHKRVAETGEPALIEVTSSTFQPSRQAWPLSNSGSQAVERYCDDDHRCHRPLSTQGRPEARPQLQQIHHRQLPLQHHRHRQDRNHHHHQSRR